MKNERKPLDFLENKGLFREVMDAKKANVIKDFEEKNRKLLDMVNRKSILLRESDEKKL